MTIHSVSVILENVSKPTIKTELPHPQQRIDRTDQLVYCNSLLLQDTSSNEVEAFEKVEQAWLAEIKDDPMERDRLQWLATRMVDTFIQEGIKDSIEIAETVALGPILPKEPYRKLLSSLIKEFDDSSLLDVDVLQGLVQLFQSATPGYLVSDDLVRILSTLRIRLQGTHQQSSEYPYHLTLAISRVLDIMADHKVQNLDRVVEHEPLSGVLSGLKGSTDPYLMYQACYAFQALQYVPNDETVLQSVLRHSRGVVEGVVKITALGKLDLGSVLEGLENLQEALGGIMDVAGTVYEGVGSMMESGQGVMESLKEKYGGGQKRPWYAAVRVAYALAEDGQLKGLNRLICEVACRRDPLFQWGICQLLGEIAIDSIWPASSRQQAITLLGRLYKEDPDWGRDECVRAWMLTIIDKLGSTLDQEVAAGAKALMQELATDDTPATAHPYPLRSRLPTPATSPILAKVLDIPYLEYELYKLRLQRFQEYNERAIYIPPQAKPSFMAKESELFPLLEKVQEFLASDRQVMLILGDSGSGKSTFNRHLEHQLWTEYKRGGMIPLFINLATIEDPQHDLVDKQLQSLNFDEDQILELKMHRQLILICDGYDESQQLVNLHKTNSLNQPGQWNTKMVISCRSQYLGPSYQDRFKPQSTDRYKSAPQNAFQEAFIAPFSREQIEDYVEKYVPLEPRTWSKQDYMVNLATIPNLMGLVSNPFLLLLALEALPEVTKGKSDVSTIKVVRIQLYDTFVNHWLNVNKRRLQDLPTLSREDYDMLEQLEEVGFVAMGVDYSRRLASALFEKQNGRAIVQYIHLKDKASWKVEYFGPDPKIRLLREASPLTRTSSYFQFLHKSILEYFFSCTVVGPSDLEHDDESSPQSTLDVSNVQSLDPVCPLFTRTLLGESSVVQFLSERVQANPAFKNQLLEVVEKSKTDPSLDTAAANAITILVRADLTFHRFDFRGIRIPRADLSGGQFDSTLFQGADLTGVNLGMSWLRNADCRKARMEGVQFGELPYLKEEDCIWACCYSPDGRILAAGGSSGLLVLYDTETKKKVRLPVKHKDDINCLAFSPDSRRLVTGESNNTVRMWDCTTGKRLLIMRGHMDVVLSVAFSPCGKKVASSSEDETVRLWDSVTGKVLHVLEDHEDQVNMVKFTPDGRRLASGSDDDTIRFWDAETGAPGEVWEHDLGTVECLDISPDGQQVVSGHEDGSVRFWNTDSGAAGLVLRGHTHSVTSVIFSSDGQRIASAGNDSTVRVWDSSSGNLVSVFNTNATSEDISFSLDSLQIASADGSDVVRLWQTTSRGTGSGQHSHSEDVLAVAYLPNGQSLWSASKDLTVRHWDALTGAVRSVREFDIDLATALAISPDSLQLAAAEGSFNVQLVDIQTGELGPLLEGHTGDVTNLVYSPCGQWIASSSEDRTARLWALQGTGEGHVVYQMTSKPKSKADSDDDETIALAFSPTGSLLAISVPDGTVNVYDTKTRTLLATTKIKEESFGALEFSPNGQELALGGDDKIYFWNFQSKKPGHKLDIRHFAIGCMSYSPCGKWIAFAEEEKSSVQLCRRRRANDLTAWRHVTVVEGSLDWINSIAWNPVTPLEFATCSLDRSVRVWRISEGEGGSGGEVSVDLVWGSNIGMLGASGMRLEGVVGLNDISRKLLKQRGAVGSALLSKEDEANAFSEEEWETDED